MVIWCIEYITNGVANYTEIKAKTKMEAIKILIEENDLTEFEYTIWRKTCG